MTLLVVVVFAMLVTLNPSWIILPVALFTGMVYLSASMVKPVKRKPKLKYHEPKDNDDEYLDMPENLSTLIGKSKE